ncbi:MAG: hypothetical protein KAX53_06085 [Saprospiraceae bacterium]|nr:hypothetical protein [Saprospiraceae bacterium]
MQYLIVVILILSFYSCSKFVPLGSIDFYDSSKLVTYSSNKALIEYDSDRFKDKLTKEHFKCLSFAKGKMVNSKKSRNLWNSILIKPNEPYLIAFRDTFPREFAEFWVYGTVRGKIKHDEVSLIIESFYYGLENRNIQFLFYIPEFKEIYWFIENNQLKVFYLNDVTWDDEKGPRAKHIEMDAKEFMKTKVLDFK